MPAITITASTQNHQRLKMLFRFFFGFSARYSSCGDAIRTGALSAGAPHSEQNFVPSCKGAPHCLQNAIVIDLLCMFRAFHHNKNSFAAFSPFWWERSSSFVVLDQRRLPAAFQQAVDRA